MARRLGLGCAIALLAAALASPRAAADPKADARPDKTEKAQAKTEKAKAKSAKAKGAKAKAKPKPEGEKPKPEGQKTDGDKPVAGPPEPETGTAIGDRRINLFPERVLQKRSQKTERERRTTLGDDRNWKVQAVQVGAMVGIFGALAVLCGSGNCMMPKAVNDAVPDFLKSDQPVYSNPRRSQPVRNAR